MTRCAVVLLALVSLAFAGDETPQALEKARKQMELLLRKGEVLEKMGDVDGALRLYEQALAVYEAASREKEEPDRGRRMGANRRTTAAVKQALGWLAEHQDEDGRWDCDDFKKHDPAGDKCSGAGGALYDVGVTGLAVLAFLGDGHTDRGSARDNPHSKTVRMGLRFLIEQQDKQGCFGRRASQHFMYNTSIATAALCEAYSLTKNPRYKKSAAAGAKFLLMARNPYLAWRYEPRGGENDTSISGWCVYALVRAQRAGLVEKKDFQAAMKGALAWLEKVTDPDFGQTGYNMRGGSVARPEGKIDQFPPEKSQALTASAILMRLRAGQSAKSEVIQKGTKLVVDLAPQWKPKQGTTDLYFWFWGTRACFQVGGPHWKRWNSALQAAVLPQQHNAGAKAGSWDPVGPWGADGGRVYSTALLALTLQTYWDRPVRR
ncbi:MAG: prenyltransferase/squalene oxidase repeat-containing protein [Planctomycetota bacterium]|jgi:tetratricopeptide (TPR) repeat protein